MASSYTSNSGIEKPAEGDQTGEWGDTVNTNMDIIDRSINGVGAITLSGTTHTLTTTDGTLSDGMYKVLVLGGSPSGTNTITISPNDQDKVYIVVNGSGQTATFTQGSGGNVSVLNGDSKIIYADGAGSGAAVVDVTADLSFSSVNIDGGTIDGTAIGGASAAAGSFTTLDTSSTVNLNLTTDSSSSTSGALIVDGGVGIAKKLYVGTDADIDGTLEADAMTLNGTAITTTATLSTGISNTNVPVFTTGVADDDFLRVAGTSIEGRSASEVLSDIGGQASLTFGISNTNAVKIDSASVADDEYARFTANGLESRSTAEVLSDIGGQASLTFGISNTNAVKIDSASVADDEYARFTANGLESRSTAEVLSDIGGQASLTFGISNTNAVKIDSASVADDEYARFTANGLESRSTSEVLSDIGASAAAGSSSIVTTGALDAGSITSGFGTINNGSSAITTTGLISGGSLDIDDVVINGSTIGHTDDTDLITVANGIATVAGEVSMTTLDIGGTNVTSTAAEINLIDGGTARGTTAVASGDGILINDAGTMRMTNVDTVSTYFASHSVGGSNIVTTGALNSGSITSGFGAIDNGSSAITTTGVITGGTVEATTDTAAGDNAAIGYTSAEGLILTGQGSTSDVTIKNDADATVISIPTGTSNVSIGETATTARFNAHKSSVVYAELGTATNGHFFSAQSDDNTDAFEIYQQHGSNTTRNTFVITDNHTGSKGETFLVRGDGRVGIGTTAPDSLVEIASGGATTAKVSTSATNSYAEIIFEDGNAGYGFQVRSDGAAGLATGSMVINDRDSSSFPLVINEGCATNTLKLSGGNVSVGGALSKGSGSFKIDHPLESKKDTHYLAHSFVEGAQADNIYRGKINLVDGQATVNIDTVSNMTEGTFVALNRDIQCFTTNETGWTAVKGSVSDNVLTINAQDNTCTDTISWLVIGERQDPHMYEVDWTDENGKVITEPLKEES